MNPREVLGVTQSASQTEIKQAFRDAAKELHPDRSDSPEAAEAFARIKEAHDRLMSEAGTPRESSTAYSSAARAASATAQAAFSVTQPQQPTDEELARIQELDEQVRTARKRSLFSRTKESAEARHHRKKLRTNERRLRGLY